VKGAQLWKRSPCWQKRLHYEWGGDLGNGRYSTFGRHQGVGRDERRGELQTKILAKVFAKINKSLLSWSFQEKKTKLVSTMWKNKRTISVKIFVWHNFLADLSEKICFCENFSENVCSPKSFRKIYVVKQTQTRRGSLQKLVVFVKYYSFRFAQTQRIL
jgi:hypothetical protein